MKTITMQVLDCICNALLVQCMQRGTDCIVAEGEKYETSYLGKTPFTLSVLLCEFCQMCG